jgi:hypothetical protein
MIFLTEQHDQMTNCFIYKTLFNLTFLQVKMPVLSQENDGCPMSVVGNVKTFVAALCSMNILIFLDKNIICIQKNI